MMRSGGSVQKAQDFMCSSLSSSTHIVGKYYLMHLESAVLAYVAELGIQKGMTT